jgi:hypothetical protein
MAIIKANYVTRAKGAVKRMGRAANYYTHREGQDRAARQWYGKEGGALGYDQVREEIREHARTYGYSYRVVLSTAARDLDVGVEGYRQVLGERFDHYYLIQHHNTDYPHCHVIGFTKSLLKRDELTQMRERLVEREQERGAERAQERDQAQETGLEQERGRQASREQELEFDR